MSNDPQSTILEEIARGQSQDSIALTYAFILRQQLDTADWPRINAAIRERWKGASALARIKKAAWKYADGYPR